MKLKMTDLYVQGARQLIATKLTTTSVHLDDNVRNSADIPATPAGTIEEPKRVPSERNLWTALWWKENHWLPDYWWNTIQI